MFVDFGFFSAVTQFLAELAEQRIYTIILDPKVEKKEKEESVESLPGP